MREEKIKNRSHSIPLEISRYDDSNNIVEEY
jgi:hypothetical protein